MTNASRDANGIPSLIVALNTDGKTVVKVAVNPTTHALCISDGTTGTDYGPKHAIRDENNVPSAMGVSSADFEIPVVVYGNSNHNLLVDSV